MLKLNNTGSIEGQDEDGWTPWGFGGLMSTREILAQSGIRCTRQRMVVYDALLASDQHPTADELHQTVSRSGAGPSLATVYNTLEILCNRGLARKIPDSRGRSRFDADTTQHMHVKFIDRDAIADVPLALSQRLLHSIPREAIARIEDEMGIAIDSISIQLLARVAEQS